MPALRPANLDDGNDSGTPKKYAETYEAYRRPTSLSSIKEDVIGLDGMKIDRMFFEKFEDTVRSDDFVAKAVQSGQWDHVIDYVNPRGFQHNQRSTTILTSCAKPPPWTAV